MNSYALIRFMVDGDEFWKFLNIINNFKALLKNNEKIAVNNL